MTTNFPAGLDAFQNPQPETRTRALNPLLRHARQHQDINDAVEALQAKVGVDLSAVTSSLDYKLTALTASLGVVNAAVVTNSNAISALQIQDTVHSAAIQNLQLKADNTNAVPTTWESNERNHTPSFATAAASQGLRMSYFTAETGGTTSSVTIVVGTAAGATPTIARVGLYLLDGAGNGTLVASTTNDTALVSGANAPVTKAWTTPYLMVKGSRYAVGLLIVTAASLPTLAALVFDGTTFAVTPRMTGFIAGQANLPASFTAGSVGTSGTMHYFRLA